MSGFEDHAEHLSPNCLCFQGFMNANFTTRRHGLVLGVAIFERPAIKIMEVWHVVG